MFRRLGALLLVLLLTASLPLRAQAPGGSVEIDGKPGPGVGFIRQNGNVLLPVEALGKAVGAQLTLDAAGHFVVWNGKTQNLHSVQVSGLWYAPWYDLQPLLAGRQLDIHGETVSLHKPGPIAPPPPPGAARGEDVVRELNLARTDPPGYARFLEERRTWYKQDGLYTVPGQKVHVSKEGLKALEDAIRYLHAQSPVPALTFSPGMSKAAAEFVAQVGPINLWGNRGTDGSTPADRVARYGQAGGVQGEDIDYGWADPRFIVIDLIIDDGYADRGHRSDVFSPDFGVAGAAVGPQGYRGSMCCIDLVGSYQERLVQP